MNYICEKCGAILDPGEKCDCQLEKNENKKEPEKQLTSEEVEEAFTGVYRQKTENRLEICIYCGTVWNISKQKEISKYGYICPYCKSKQKDR